MSPKMVLVWMSWAFIMTSFINCETIEDALHNIFRRLTYLENAMANSASNRNGNSNCNTNKINIGRRNSMGGEAPIDKALGDENNEDDRAIRNYDDFTDESQRKGFRFRKIKRNRGRYNSRPFSADNYYPSIAAIADLNGNLNTNQNQNQNINVNKNVVSRRSDHGANNMAAPNERDSDSYAMSAEA